MMKIGKICLKVIFGGLLAIEDLSCNQQKAQAASDATQQMLMRVMQSSEEKLHAFQQKIE